MPDEPRGGQVTYGGHRIRYRAAGQGSVVVLVKPHLRPKDYPQVRLLSDRYHVVQIDPLGFGASDRPADYPPVNIPEQVLMVLDHEGIDRFAVWGYSKGGHMAAAVAQASPRAVAMVAGGCSLVGWPTDAWMRRMDREGRVPVASRIFWHYVKRFDWLDELGAMRCPRLVYVGGEHRGQATRLRRLREPLTERGVTVMEFGGARRPRLRTRTGPVGTGRTRRTGLARQLHRDQVVTGPA